MSNERPANFKEYQLINYTEVMVRDLLDDTLANLNICDCAMCRLDIIALALNHLPPNYAITTEGLMFQKLNNLKAQHSVDIIAEITRAATAVSKNSRHKESC